MATPGLDRFAKLAQRAGVIGRSADGLSIFTPASTNLGVGNAAPAYALDVAGQVRASGGYVGLEQGFLSASSVVPASAAALSNAYGTLLANGGTWGSNTAAAASNQAFLTNTARIDWNSNAAQFGSNAVGQMGVVSWPGAGGSNEQTLASVFRSNVDVAGTLTVRNLTYLYSNITVYAAEEVRSNMVVQGTVSLSNSTGAVVLYSSNTGLGIGTATPATTLDVNGTSTLRGLVSATAGMSLSGTTAAGSAPAVTISSTSRIITSNVDTGAFNNFGLSVANTGYQTGLPSGFYGWISTKSAMNTAAQNWYNSVTNWGGTYNRIGNQVFEARKWSYIDENNYPGMAMRLLNNKSAATERTWTASIPNLANSSNVEILPPVHAGIVLSRAYTVQSVGDTSNGWVIAACASNLDFNHMSSTVANPAMSIIPGTNSVSISNLTVTGGLTAPFYYGASNMYATYWAASNSDWDIYQGGLYGFNFYMGDFAFGSSSGPSTWGVPYNGYYEVKATFYAGTTFGCGSGNTNNSFQLIIKKNGTRGAYTNVIGYYGYNLVTQGTTMQISSDGVATAVVYLTTTDTVSVDVYYPGYYFWIKWSKGTLASPKWPTLSVRLLQQG